MRLPNFVFGKFVVLMVVFAAGSVVWGACQEGKSVACRVNGKQGTRECVNGRFTPCQVDGPQDETGTVTVAPKFYVLTVVYAPPGTAGGGSRSSVVYGNGSSSGSKVSSSRSFKAGSKISVEASGGILGVDSGAEASFAVSKSSTSAEELEIKKSASSEITLPGPPVDGIDHNEDQIWLWLNPRLKVTATGDLVRWSVLEPQTADVTFVFVGHLKDPSKMPPQVAKRLAARGITPADYPTILRANPMAGNGLFIDAKRYVPLFTTFPYQPPFSPDSSQSTFSVSLTSSSTQTATQSVEKETKVGMKLTAEGGFPGFAKLKLASESEWTWSNKSSGQVSNGTAESAKATVGMPSFGYQGPIDMMVYYDTLYKTFMFAPLAEPIQFQGVLTSASKQRVAGQEVAVTVKGRTFRTFTNSRGEYRLPVALSGEVEFRVGGVKQRVKVPSTQKRFDLQVK